MRAQVLLAALFALAACRAPETGASDTVPVTITGASGRHVFVAEIADTPAEQARGLKYREPLAPDRAMLFAPYPPAGNAPREASFWMKDTPASLDILFVRADGTIARIEPDTVPYSELPVRSGEPVAAVLEIRGGRAAEIGVAEGDRMTWPRARATDGG